MPKLYTGILFQTIKPDCTFENKTSWYLFLFVSPNSLKQYALTKKLSSPVIVFPYVVEEWKVIGNVRVNLLKYSDWSLIAESRSINE